VDRTKTDPSIKMFAIESSENAVGVCGLTSIDRVNQKAEFSLYIAPKYQRRGYARSALTLLLMHGFWDQNLNRIWGETFQDNPARKMFQSVGMHWEGMFDDAYYRSGKFIYSQIWAMTKKEFNKKYGELRDSTQSTCSDNEPILIRRESGVDIEKASQLGAHPLQVFKALGTEGSGTRPPSNG
jgi:hypothetical protein